VGLKIFLLNPGLFYLLRTNNMINYISHVN